MDGINVIWNRDKQKLAESAGKVKRNISISELKCLANFIRDRDICISIADKNMGFVVVDTEWMAAAANFHLVDPNRFQRFERPLGLKLLSLLYESIRSIWSNLYLKASQSLTYSPVESEAKIYDFVIKPLQITSPTEVEKSLLSMSILPKVHKGKFDPSTSRPIVGFHKSPVQHLCIWMAKLMDPVILKLCPTVIRDSTDLVRRLVNLKANGEIWAITADASNLYGNFPAELLSSGYAKLFANLRQNGVELPFSLTYEGLHDMVLLANQTCFIDSGDVIFQQIKGFAMGRADGPHLANWCLGIIERLRHESYPEEFSDVLLHGRYIDDVILIVHGLNGLNQARQLLNWYRATTEMDWTSHEFCLSSDFVRAPFLDLEIFRLEDRILTSSHWKITNLGLFLPPFSQHPIHTFKAWVKAELMRYARNSSLPIDYWNSVRVLNRFLLSRGYKPGFVLSMLKQANYKRDRDYLLNKTGPQANFRQKKLDFSRDLFLKFPFFWETRVFTWKQELKELIEKLSPDLLALGVSTPNLILAWKNTEKLGSIVLDSQSNFSKLDFTDGAFNPNPKGSPDSQT